MYERIRPLLFTMDAERAHGIAVLAARSGQRLLPSLVERMFAYEDERLAVSVFGRRFSNPLGLAAGFDKNGVLIPFWHLAGLGFTEVGSVSAIRSKGNPRPRAFRLPQDEALINRMGLNNHGAERIARRLRARHPFPYPVGINIVKTHDPAISGPAGIEDFRFSFRALRDLADYVVLNLSCPNTAEGKTFEDPNTLDDLLTALAEDRNEIPILLKLSPPVTDRMVLDSEVDEIVAVARAHGISGYVASNTAPDREHLASPRDQIEHIGRGGLSGRPLESRATRLVKYLYQKTGGSLPIIGVGGVHSPESAYRKIRAGASLVQLYTGLVYGGPGLVRSIKKGLAELLDRDGLSSIGDAVGLDAG